MKNFPFLLLLMTAGSDNSRKLAEIQQGNASSTQMIRSIHCKYNIEQAYPKGGKFTQHLEWWQDGNKVRWSETFESVPQEIGRPKDKERTFLSSEEMRMRRRKEGYVDKEVVVFSKNDDEKDKDPLRVQIAALSSSWDSGFGDLWDRSLFTVISRPRLTLSDILKKGEGIRLSTAGTQDSCHIEFKNDEKSRYDIWVNTKRNYLVEKFVYSGDPTTLYPRIETEVLSFCEPKPTLFFPKKTETRTLQRAIAGKPETLLITSCIFDLVEINLDIPAETFAYRIPAGASVMDDVRGITYIMGEDGHPGEPSPAPKAPTKPGKVKLSPRDLNPESAQSNSFLHSKFVWGAFVVLVVGFLVAAAARFKRKWNK